MTKTEHLNLNLLEAHDPVSSAAAALNANTQALDAAIAADRAAAAAEHSAVYGEIGRLDGRTDGVIAALTAAVGVTGRNCRVVWGTYTGAGRYGATNPSSISFDFYPLLVVVGSQNGAGKTSWPTVMIRGCGRFGCESANSAITATWTDHTITWHNTGSAENQNNESNRVYYYVALGCDD